MGSKLDEIVDFCHFEEHDGNGTKYLDCDVVKAKAKADIKSLFLEIIGEDEILPPEKDWYAKTKAYGGTHEEYWRLKAIANNYNNFRAELRKAVESL